jgi:hypothetical protein
LHPLERYEKLVVRSPTSLSNERVLELMDAFTEPVSGVGGGEVSVEEAL